MIDFDSDHIAVASESQNQFIFNELPRPLRIRIFFYLRKPVLLERLSAHFLSPPTLRLTGLSVFFDLLLCSLYQK